MSQIFEDLLTVLQLVALIPPSLLPFVFAFAFLLFAIKWDSKRHLLCKLEATQQLKRLKRCDTHQKQMAQLRGVNPFVFEEMILTALKQHGYEIKRNKRYSGDGGIDGQVRIKNDNYLIQAKRYKNHINPTHVQTFVRLCRKRGEKGLFVHTGKTGKKSYQVVQNSDVTLISGKRLLNMLVSCDRGPQGRAETL